MNDEGASDNLHLLGPSEERGVVRDFQGGEPERSTEINYGISKTVAVPFVNCARWTAGMTPGEMTRATIREAARYHRASVKEVLAGGHAMLHVSAARWRAIKHFRQQGLGWSHIKRALNIHHTTAMHAERQMAKGLMPWDCYRGRGKPKTKTAKP